ncbi:MAG: biopolymer transporter ExbD [Halobacteriovoraceae bacterium]|jgi:biopolymer transport protein ExbD|nr:biopolymer transporter ExbD [Halobacteriovoraceae bacterium]
MKLNSSLVAADAFEKHLINRNRKKSWGKKAAVYALMLTSMVDMFSMLVVFLLQTFSTSPEIMLSKGVILPNSLTASQVKEAPVLAISKDGNLYLDQLLVGVATKVVTNPTKLINQLNQIKNSWAKNHVGIPFPGEVNLQADKEVSSVLVSQVMAILTSGQFQAIQLAVMGIR